MRKIIFIFFIFLIFFANEFKICPVCETKNPQDALYCSNCGYKFTSQDKSSEKFIICPNCNYKNPIDAKFCANCGFPLKKDAFLKDTLKIDTTFIYSPLAESIYSELKKIRQLLSQKKIEEIKQKSDDGNFLDLLILGGCGLLLLSFIMFLK